MAPTHEEIGRISRIRRIVLLAVAVCAFASAQDDGNLLANPSFEGEVQANGVPTGWSLYGGADDQRRIEVVELPGEAGHALHIDDSHDGAEVGVCQKVAVEAGKAYLATVRVKAVEDASPAGAHVQLRFLPSNEIVQRPLTPGPGAEFGEVQVGKAAPPGSKEALLYLYTHKEPKPRIIIDDVRLEAVDELPAGLASGGKPEPPEITALKPLYLETSLITEGQPEGHIVAPASGIYDAEARAIAAAVEELTGVALPIVADTASDAGLPLTRSAIILGNRSTNGLLEQLYNRHYTLLDLCYPGPGGYVVRSLHNPFGNGVNAVLVGGSDEEGVHKAAEVLVEKLKAASGPSSLQLGWLMEIGLGEGVELPTELRLFETWEASVNYRSTGYFGWNSISKRMAMYYMTGDPFHAREALRLAFPDNQAKQEISDIDGERIENKDDPLAGPYHYNAHLMILYWDLIEESPVFTDEERLRVTQAFSRQLLHHGINAAYVGPYASTPAHVGSRHGQWTAISLYCLGRYFAKDYAHPIWKVCEENGANHFRSLHTHAWVSGENDNLFWYDTAIAPIFTYLVLTGDREPLENGVAAQLLRGLEILVSGRVPDWALNAASLGFLHKAAYLTQDGRWLEYRNRTDVDVGKFRLGQSFWPEEHIEPTLPEDMVNAWQVNPMPEPMWKWRRNGFALDESFLFMSYRNRPDEEGDFILLDGFNGASRNPYHTFAILELRLDGQTILEGYLNQVLTRADGMTERQIAMNAALKHHDVLGSTAIAVAEVPDAAYVNWRRAVVQRVGRYALVMDELTPRVDTENLEVQLLWEAKRGQWQPDAEVKGRLRLAGAHDPAVAKAGALDFRAPKADIITHQTGGPDWDRKMGVVLMRAMEAGAWLEMPFTLSEPASGECTADFLNYLDRGYVSLAIDGKVVLEKYEHHADEAVEARVPLGRLDFEAGTHRLRVTTVGKYKTNEPCYIAFGGLTIQTDTDLEPRVPAICMSEADDVLLEGFQATGLWTGPARQGVPKRFFSLIASSNAPEAAFDSAPLSPTSAALALPEPALAVAGVFEDVDAEWAVVAGDHLYAKGAKAVAGLVRSDVPVDIDWDFASGIAEVAVNEAAALEMTSAGGAVHELAPGRHRIEVTPETEALDALHARLTECLAKARRLREKAASTATAQAQATELSPLPQAATAQLSEAIVDFEMAYWEDTPHLCAATGQAIHVLTADGAELRTLQTDDLVRMLRWWPEHGLLLAGCADEKVIAFDGTGARQWVFVSEMDPAVFRAAKTYWFKSAPGHEGIHGLHTGVFLDGKSQAFVGSACTLEIIDEHGQLIKRMPQFWGKVSTMRIIPSQGDSLNLLAARKYNGTNSVAVINNRTLDPTPRSFYSVPPGHTHVPGWSSMNRHHLFYEDFDGDGAKDVMSEINGFWNRVTVWAPDGTAKYDASFGPGKRIPALNMRDIDIADLDGDGLPEIIVVTSSKMAVALDGDCEKLWAKRLDSAPNVMNCVTPAEGAPPWIIIGCEDGAVLMLDKEGQPMRSAKLDGAATTIQPFTGADGRPRIALGTATGAVAVFEMGDGPDFRTAH